MLQVFLLGQFDLDRDGKRILIPSRAGQTLFAFLVLHAHTLYRREYLAGQLWGNLSEEQARHHLRQELWRVRKALCPSDTRACAFLIVDEIEIGFNARCAYSLDADEFRHRAPHSTTELMKTLSLYRGELLPGFYEDWVLREREMLGALYEAHMCELLERLVAERAWACVLEWAERWIVLSETPEPAFRALMYAYAALGDHAKLKATFTRCEHALRASLDVEPAAETRALYQQLRHSATMDSE